MSSKEFTDTLRPFFWSEHENSASVCLEVGGYRNEIFATRAAEGFEGSGYDWASLAQVFLTEQQPQLAGIVKFDPEGSMFCAYSADKEALKQFALAFKIALDDERIATDLLSRAELD
ncbi:immunity 51 family protein [Hymenobacter sp. DG01]|uniref:immunity 51 family protein n=1 Tax=Hymenobacter sp. DG01 TaxID=2584940 RepID=UPI0011210C87|nr:immunity 51 family protein [Hymenobacter sp. DG01]